MWTIVKGLSLNGVIFGPYQIINTKLPMLLENLVVYIYSGSLTISPLADQDDGTYTCTVTVTGGANVQSATASDAVIITVMGKYGLYILFVHNSFLKQLYQLQ